MHTEASIRFEGSSPLTRGKRLTTGWQTSSTRLIPAHAAKTRNSTKPSWTSAAHPRSRWENTSAMRGRLRKFGSSPLTRGKLDVPGDTRDDERLIPTHAGKTRAVLILGIPEGLIPTHAGKTARLSMNACIHAADPRSCGENFESFRQSVETVGSSPLMRG